MTCRGADQIMLMYVARSMNLWASTDMRLTISPTVEVFLAALVITRACGTKKRERGWVWQGTARAPIQAHVEERRQRTSGEVAAFSSPGGLSAFPARVSRHKGPSLIDSTHCLPPT